MIITKQTCAWSLELDQLMKEIETIEFIINLQEDER